MVIDDVDLSPIAIWIAEKDQNTHSQPEIDDDVRDLLLKMRAAVKEVQKRALMVSNFSLDDFENLQISAS